MSDFTADVSTLGGIIGDFFDGKASLDQAGQRLGVLNAAIGRQVTTEANKIGQFLGPQATAEIQAGFNDVKNAAGAAAVVIDADLAPYMAGAARAAEGAVDSVLTAALGPGAAALTPLLNGGIDAIVGGIKAAADAQAAAWKAKMAASVPAPAQPASPAPASAPASAG